MSKIIDILFVIALGVVAVWLIVGIPYIHYGTQGCASTTPGSFNFNGSYVCWK